MPDLPFDHRIGGAPPLLLSSGWGVGWWVWEPLRESLAGRFESWAVDPRGVGASHSALLDAESWSLDEAVADLANAAKRCGVPPIVVGSSMSGGMALLLAARQPHAIAGVVSIGGTPCSYRDANFPFGFTRDEAAGLAGALRVRFVETTTSLLPGSYFSRDDQERHPTLAGRLIEGATSVERPKAVIRLLEHFWETDLRSILSTIRTPVLLLHGENDVLAPPAVGQLMAHQIPFARLEIVPGAGHLPQLTRSAEVAEAITRFALSLG
jgi:pimeloyl-ACP methyl ester carboxylesterase